MMLKRRMKNFNNALEMPTKTMLKAIFSSEWFDYENPQTIHRSPKWIQMKGFLFGKHRKSIDHWRRCFSFRSPYLVFICNLIDGVFQHDQTLFVKVKMDDKKMFSTTYRHRKRSNSLEKKQRKSFLGDYFFTMRRSEKDFVRCSPNRNHVLL